MLESMRKRGRARADTFSDEKFKEAFAVSLSKVF